MRVEFNINWSETKYYAAGHRHVSLQWESYSNYLPRAGETMNIPRLLGHHIKPEDQFRIEKTTYTIFEWVEDTMGWLVRNVHWDFDDKGAFLSIHVTDGVD